MSARLRATWGRAGLLVLTCALLQACLTATEVEGEPADARGVWTFTGSQVAPARTLVGTLTIASQSGEAIAGSLSWEERDGGGVVATEAGPVTGRVLGAQDIDFDVLLAAGSRRHVARLSADTMSGTWLRVSGGLTGDFRAVRENP